MKWGHEFINWCVGWRGVFGGWWQVCEGCEIVSRCGSQHGGARCCQPESHFLSQGDLVRDIWHSRKWGADGVRADGTPVEILDLDRTVDLTSSFALLPGMVNYYFILWIFFLIAHQASRWKGWQFALFPPAVSGMVLWTMYVFRTLC